MENQSIYNTLQTRDTIRFSKNFNNKLNCELFTTIRLKNKKFEQNKTLRILLEQNGVLKTICDVRIVDIKPLRIHQLNDWICLLDSGKTTDQMKDMLYYMYKDKVADLNQAEFVYLMLEKVKIQPVQNKLFE